MKILKLSVIALSISLFLLACGQTGEPQASLPSPTAVPEAEPDNDYWAHENLDLPRVGEVLEKADGAQEFEYLLNSEDGVNNLDLNGDGYVDYISVAEFDDRDDGQRGFSLFSRFGPDDIQELATIIFDRDRPDRTGARVFLRGNEQIYGDDNYYERNWLDKSLAIAGWVFGNRPESYRSQYHNDNYPDKYVAYRVVGTPVYRTRVTRLYPAPGFTVMINPAMTKIKIKSPHQGRSINKIYAKLAKPTKEQKDFIKNNPAPPDFVPVQKDPGKHTAKPEKDEKPDKPGKPDKPDTSGPKTEKPGKPVEKPAGKDDKQTGPNAGPAGKKKDKGKN